MYLSQKEINQQVKSLEGRINNGNIDPDTLPYDTWSMVGWDYLDFNQSEAILVNMWKHTFRDALKSIPFYKDNPVYSTDSENKLKTIERIADIINIFPIITKDQIRSFEEFSTFFPYCCGGVVYRTTGTTGAPTPFKINSGQHEIEAHRQAAIFKYAGMGSHTVLLNCYDSSSHGGRAINQAVEVLGGSAIPRKTGENAEQLVNIIEKYNVNSIAVVQPPLENESSKGVTFMSLYEKKPQLFGEKGLIKLAFITGFQVPEEILKQCNTIGLDVFTVLGSSEGGIPQSYSTPLRLLPDNSACYGNSQHLSLVPYHISMVKYDGKKYIPVKAGEDGLIVLNSIAANGSSININYSPGDIATVIKNHGECACSRTSMVIGNIRRADADSSLGVGCGFTG